MGLCYCAMAGAENSLKVFCCAIKSGLLLSIGASWEYYYRSNSWPPEVFWMAGPLLVPPTAVPIIFSMVSFLAVISIIGVCSWLLLFWFVCYWYLLLWFPCYWDLLFWVPCGWALLLLFVINGGAIVGPANISKISVILLITWLILISNVHIGCEGEFY